MQCNQASKAFSHGKNKSNQVAKKRRTVKHLNEKKVKMPRI